jgi:hypothetical protein
MPSKDRSKEPTKTTPAAGKGATPEIEWPRLLARLIEGIVSAELHEFEDTVMAFLDSAVDDAYQAVVWIGARVIGAAFLLAGIVLFAEMWLPRWAAFASVGVLVIALGSFAGVRRRPRKRRRYR